MPPLARLSIFLLTAWLALPLCAAAAPAEADLLLRGGTIYDGSGAEALVGDVAIAGAKIVAVGRFEGKAARVIDCQGLLVAPGFIDLHTHCDAVATNEKLRPNLSYLVQGCTTVVTGNCGGGAIDVADFFRKEALQIGRTAGLPVEISHFKAVGRVNWGMIHQAAGLIEKARASGQVVTADQYPYIATSTGIGPTLFPATKLPGGMKDFAKRIQSDPAFKEQVRKLVIRQMGEYSKLVIASYKASPEWTGRSLDEIARSRKMDPVDLAIEIQSKGGASVVKFCLSEDDVRYAMTIPWVATGSDGSCLVPDPKTCPHPRSYGAFARKIGLYAIREKVLPLAAAIRRASGLPADILKLPGRGYLRPGYTADLVVLDPRQYIDRATFEKPHQYATGVRYVLLAGKAAIDNAHPTGQLLGRAIRHGGI